MNDRALRNVVVGLGGAKEGVPRETGFDITAASEVMAMLCLAEGVEDLRARLDRTLVAFTYDGEPVTASSLKSSGAMLALLRDALMPNLVQSLEGVPALVHGGPFANIAHGCSSVIATRMAMQLADWTITEAGFGFDLGAEKFFDIKCRSAGLDTAAVVLVARAFGEAPVVALNRFRDDTEAEIEVVRARCAELRVAFAVSDHHARGGEGALDLARALMTRAEESRRPFRPLYELRDPVPEKILAVARTMYGAAGVEFTSAAERDLRDVGRLGCAGLPVCIAKTQSSLSDDPRRRGRPRDFEVTVRRVLVNSGAGFLVVITGEMLRMPGLPQTPLAESIDLDGWTIVGLQGPLRVRRRQAEPSSPPILFPCDPRDRRAPSGEISATSNLRARLRCLTDETGARGRRM
jgi:formate--tetrahydrofolate ligase